LGYRGCFLRAVNGEREWVAYRGVVTLRTPAGDESREGEGREFESILIKSAPAGLIPAQVMETEDLPQVS
jgi:hypothetical protein